MKKQLSVLASALLIFSFNLSAQTSSSSIWHLTSDQSPVITGDVSASDQTLAEMQVSYSSDVQRSSPAGTAGAWPGESEENESRYMQFAVTPASGNLFEISEVSMYLYVNSGSNMKANVYYSTDSTFTERTQIGSTFSLTNSAPGSPNVTVEPGTIVNDGEHFYLRIYPWYTSSTSGKYVITKDVTVSGITNSAVSVRSSVNSLSGFLQTNSNPSQIQTYTLTGINLTDSILITPSAGVEISNDAGNNWYTDSSPLTLKESEGGIENEPVTISVRIISDSAGEFSGEIIHTSTGAPAKTVKVTGVRLAEEPTQQSFISFGEVTGSSIKVNFSGGNGGYRIVVAKENSEINWTPEDGNKILGVNSNFTEADDQDNGNKVIFDGSDTSITVTGLKTNVMYNFAVFEYNKATGNSQNYLTDFPGRDSIQTLAVASLSADPASISFGKAIVNKDTAVNSFSLQGIYLTNNGSAGILAPADFLISLDSLSGFKSGLVIPYSGTALLLTKIFVQFIPTEYKDYSDSLVITGGGSSAIYVHLQGRGAATFVETDSPVGFASLGEGTTGGEDGEIVEISDAQSLADLLKLREGKSTEPVIIHIKTILTGSSDMIDVKRTGNISIIGEGMETGFLGFGMKIVDCSNVIVRNLNFADCKAEEKDALSIDGSSNVWVDHCSFTDSPSFDPKGSSHDGLLDIKNGAYHVTVSYNYFTNHRKGLLYGHTEKQTSDTAMQATYYRNWFDGTYSRNPRTRFGKVHMLNNYFSSVGVMDADSGGYAVGVTCEAQVLLESNYFEDTKRPVLISQINDPEETLSGDPAGYLKAVKNFSVNSGEIIENLTGFNFNPSDYYDYDAADSSLVKLIVTENAGAGNLVTAIAGKDETTFIHSFTLMQNYPNPFNPATSIQYTLKETCPVWIAIFNAQGQIVQVLQDRIQERGIYTIRWDASGHSSGIYLLKIQMGAQTRMRKMIKLD